MNMTVAGYIEQERQRLHQRRAAILNRQQELENRLASLNCEFTALEGDIDADIDAYKSKNTGRLARHFIYMICGTERRKIGVTHDLAGRMQQYRHKWGLRGRHLPIFRIIETLIDCTDREAVARKRYWSEHYCFEHRLICPHCGRAGRLHGALQRWHFDNCRAKPQTQPSAAIVRPPGWVPITRPVV
jgi:hypothetical protein